MMRSLRNYSSALMVVWAVVASALALLGATSARAQDGTPAAEPFTSIADLVERVNPAVVTVYNELQMGGMDATGVPAGTGTGFIISEQGHVVTNWHVVTGGDRYSVVFLDGERRD